VRVSIGAPVNVEPGAEPEAVAAELEKHVAALAWGEGGD
jgi:hypothetical protein